MSEKLKIAFDDPADGWVGLKLMRANEVIQIIASYTPHDSFLDLIDALYNLFLSDGEWKVIWSEEPSEIELSFRRAGNLVSVEVLKFPDYRRGTEPVSLFTLSGSYDEIAIPFWRALRSLQGRFSSEELNARWHRKFPWNEVENLTSLVRPAL